MSVTIVHLGCAGHFVGADKCQFRRHTQVDGPGGSYRVSTVGDYRPRRSGARSTIGAGDDDYFETMVFPTSPAGECEGNEGCGCRTVLSWSGVDMERYATAGEANRGHERMVVKYQQIAAGIQ